MYQDVAQLVERHVWDVDVVGSSPIILTTFVRVVQQAETPDLKSVKCGFESRYGHQVFAELV